MATTVPQAPKSKSGMILADADLFYIGTDQYDEYADRLIREMRHFDPTLTEEKWLNIQVNFLKKHHFHTDYALEVLGPKKLQHLNRLMQALRVVK
jgi:uncharacterized protein